MSFIPAPLSKIINEHSHNDHLACFFHDNRSHLLDRIVLSAPLAIKGQVLAEHKPSLSRRLRITRADSCLHFAFRSPTVKHFLSCMRAELDRLRGGLTHFILLVSLVDRSGRSGWSYVGCVSCVRWVDCVPAVFTILLPLPPFPPSWLG